MAGGLSDGDNRVRRHRQCFHICLPGKIKLDLVDDLYGTQHGFLRDATEGLQIAVRSKDEGV